MNIRGIQFGPNNYIELLPKELEVLWNYEPDLGDKDTKKWEYDIAFVERPLDRDEIDFLKGHDIRMKREWETYWPTVWDRF